jgi:F-type H+-transporting ATPase subunit beta
VLSATSRFLGGQRLTLGLNSRQLSPAVVGEDHYNTARAVTGHTTARYKEAAHFIITILGMDRLAPEQVGRGRPIRANPAFPVTAVPRRSVYQLSRQYVSLAVFIHDFKMIVAGGVTTCRRAFLVGTIVGFRETKKVPDHGRHCTPSRRYLSALKRSILPGELHSSHCR